MPDLALQQRLHDHVEHLADAIGERNVWRPAALRAAAAYIRGAFAAAGCEVQAQAYETQGVRCENLEVTLAGAEPTRIVIVGAHYDTVAGSPGANDNASGVAGLIEIARALRPMSLGCTVKLVAFVNEEPPFFFSRDMGSMVYARAAR
ncbi:MAG: M28 family peptidase, partial [Burkholderiales bacterium]